MSTIEQAKPKIEKGLERMEHINNANVEQLFMAPLKQAITKLHDDFKNYRNDISKCEAAVETFDRDTKRISLALGIQKQLSDVLDDCRKSIEQARAQLSLVEMSEALNELHTRGPIL